MSSASSNGIVTGPGPTYLRIKRRRNVCSLSSMRLDLNENADNNRKRSRPMNELSFLLQSSMGLMPSQQLPQQPPKPQCAVLRRIDEQTLEQTMEKRKIHLVDAVLEEATTLNDEPRTKRRKLALTLVASDREPVTEVRPEPTKTKQRNHNRILDPQTRLVDESLQAVLRGERALTQHLDYCTDDERLAGKDPRRWISHLNVRIGNICHVAGLLGDSEGTAAVLAWGILNMLDARDGDGNTPCQVALLAGHEQIAAMLSRECVPEEDMEHYVFDVFRLEREEDQSDGPIDVSTEDDDDRREDTVVQLRGGIGYWNENGELVLEALENIDDASVVENDDDVDSNCEEYEGNDYPDEEPWLKNEDSSGDEDNELDFRNRPVDGMIGFPELNFGQGYDTLGGGDDVFDAQYGICGTAETTSRPYAYDEELDS